MTKWVAGAQTRGLGNTHRALKDSHCPGQGVTITAAVPTVWLALLQHLEATSGRLSSLKRVVIGGAAVPRAMLDAFESKHGVEARGGSGGQGCALDCRGAAAPSRAPGAGAPRVGHDGAESSGVDQRAERRRGAAAGGAGAADAQAEAGQPRACLPACLPCLPPACLRRTSRALTATPPPPQGRAPYMVELAIKDDAGVEQMRDGQSVGRLMARGPFTLAAYFRSPPGAPPPLDGEGYFDTGDVASIDEDGCGHRGGSCAPSCAQSGVERLRGGGEKVHGHNGPVEGCDQERRRVDLVHGGARIFTPSVLVCALAGARPSAAPALGQLENAAMGHPRVGEAAVIGIPHDKWGERPLLIVAPRPGGAVPSKQSLLEHLRPLVAAWWLPDDVAYIGEAARPCRTTRTAATPRRLHPFCRARRSEGGPGAQARSRTRRRARLTRRSCASVS